jgi:hypothetical protein
MFILFGLSFLLLGGTLAFFLRQDWVLLRGPVATARAVVIDQREDRDSDGGLFYHAKIRFSPGSGPAIEVYDMVGSGRPDPATGAECTVIYPEGRPDLARIRRPILRACIYILLVAMSVLLVLASAGVID